MSVNILLIIVFLSVHRCVCLAAYTGKYCETQMDLCLDNKCMNGSKCVSHDTGYTCVCQSGKLSSASLVVGHVLKIFYCILILSHCHIIFIGEFASRIRWSIL